jgi:hypothetical protein
VTTWLAATKAPLLSNCGRWDPIGISAWHQSLLGRAYRQPRPGNRIAPTKEENVPDEQGNTAADEEKIPSTPLHAHESGIEEENARPREGNVEGELLDDDQNDAAEATNTGGSTSGGPPREDPSNE